MSSGYQVVKMKEGTRVVEHPQLTIKGVGWVLIRYETIHSWLL